MSDTNQDTNDAMDTWAIIELLGHVTVAGKLSEAAHFGTVLMRLDIPEVDGVPAYTQYYGGGAIYRLTPCSEEAAMQALKRLRPKPPMILSLPSESQEEMTLDDDGDEFPF